MPSTLIFRFQSQSYWQQLTALDKLPVHFPAAALHFRFSLTGACLHSVFGDFTVSVKSFCRIT